MARANVVDRLVVGVCVLIWLAVVGVAAAAVVALLNLGSGGQEAGSDDQTPWALYAVIGVSAAIIVVAVPLLMRARRSSLAAAARPPAGQVRADDRLLAPGYPGTEAPTEKLRVFGSISDRAERTRPVPRRVPQTRYAGGLSREAVDRVWLRVGASVGAAMGIAVLAALTATYLISIDEHTYAWVALGVAAVVTVLMPVIPWRYLRRLRATIAAAK